MRRLMILGACALTLAVACASAFAAVGPQVNVMPDGTRAGTTDTAYAWAGDSVDVWGNVKWGGSTSGNYVWSFGDGTPDATGAVTNPKHITVWHTYASAGTYFATLTVTDGSSASDSDTVRIDVVASVDQDLKVNKAIKRGLKMLYMYQQADGRWDERNGADPAPTALSVLAFENWGHKPTNDANDDIYVETVQKGLNWLCGQLQYHTPCPVQPAGNPDTHGIHPTPATADGRMVRLPWNRNNYQTGMVMMAFAAAGPYKAGSDPYDAAVNPALNLTGTLLKNDGGSVTLRYYDILAGIIDYYAWAQSDSGGARGGWRYTDNSNDSDTSAAQWPAIGMEAAENWGLLAPAFVKNELLTYWCAYAMHPTLGGWSYQHYSDTVSHNITHGGAGICMLSFCGVPKTDPRMALTLGWLSVPGNWAGNGNWYPWNLHMQGGNQTNYYGMYAIAKGCRIARDGAGNIAEIANIGAVDWYTTYCNHILAQMLTDTPQENGVYWQTTMSNYHGWDLNTPFALLILEPTIASLRPQAVLTASPNPTNALVPVAFSVGASYHQDPAKWLTNWSLDWNADGVFEDSGAFPVTDPVATHAFPDTGSNYSKTAKLVVTDNDGVTDDADLVIQITTGNLPPVPNAGGPYGGIVGQPVTLDGSASYDPNAGPPLNDYIKLYEWDTNGDGIYGDPVTPVPGHPEQAQKTWTTPYSGVIGLKCTDFNGNLSAVATVYATITVTDLKPVRYNLLSYRRINRNVWEYTWKFTMENRGNGAANNVVAVLNNYPSNVTVVDGNVSFGMIGPGAQVTSADTFTLRVDRSIPIANKDMTWKVDYDDAGGHHWTLAHMPLFLP